MTELPPNSQDSGSGSMKADMADSPRAKKRRLGDADEATPSHGQAGTEEPKEQTNRLEKRKASLKPVPGTSELEQQSASQSATKDDKSQSSGDGKPAVDSKADDDEDKLDERLTFPEKLMYMLQNEVEPKALWWQKDGASFGFEPKLFTAKVLNKLFPNKIKFESFIRKLNRWGFRRVPGQGLPPNGAAYKHPLFTKDEPELMKSMKFGQKVDSRRPEQVAVASPSSSTVPTTLDVSQFTPNSGTGRLPPENLSMAAIQGAQNAQQLALLRTLASTQQLQQQQQQQFPRLDAADHLVNQAFAMGGATAGVNDFENQLRNQILLSGLPMGLSSFQRPGGSLLSHQLQSRTGNAGGRPLTGVNDGSATLPFPSERDIRSSSLLGSTIPGPTELQRLLTASRGANPFLTPAAALDPWTSSVNSNALPTRLLGGRANTSGLSNQGQLANAAQLGAAQFADNLSLLRMQQGSPGDDASAEILLLLEQERRRQQRDQNNG